VVLLHQLLTRCNVTWTLGSWVKTTSRRLSVWLASLSEWSSHRLFCLFNQAWWSIRWLIFSTIYEKVGLKMKLMYLVAWLCPELLETEHGQNLHSGKKVRKLLHGRFVHVGNRVANFGLQIAPKCIWRPGSVRTRWASYSTPREPTAIIRARGQRGRGKTSNSAIAERSRDAWVTSIRKIAKWNFWATLLGGFGEM